MEIKVNISFAMWPYEQSMSITIPEDAFKDMDKYVDSITSNLKMALLGHVRAHHPTIWHKYSPFDSELLKTLETKTK
jgi:hypothetical protein